MTDPRQARLERAQHQGRLPSVVAATFDATGVTWHGRAGARGGEQFRIGSITKTMTAVLVLQCRDDRLLDLDDPVGRFIPETGYRDATLRDLLSHLSGMQSEPAGPWWERSPGTPFETLVAANDGSGAVAAPREWFHYSNLGFALLGEAVARVRGESWGSLVSSRLLAPLGMAVTSYHPGPNAAQGYSVGHFTGILTREPHQDTGAMAPAGQLWSTVADLVRWGRFLAAGHPAVLAAASLEEMSAPSCEEYALGLRIATGAGGVSLVGHTGSMPGFLAALFVERDTGRGVALLANATTGVAVESLALELLEGRPVPGPPEPWVPTGQVPEPLAGVPGLWFWGNSAVELRLTNGGLDLHDVMRGVLADRFEIVGGQVVGVSGYHRGERLHVVRRPDGTVSHLVCATFVYTRVPYDPAVDIPGGHPAGG